MSDSVMVIMAHPDDEVLGCGGTLAQLGEGVPLHVLYLACGNPAGSRDGRSIHDLRQDVDLALSTLGKRDVISVTYCQRFDDQRLDIYPVARLAAYLEAEISARDPREIFTHHAGDLNRDHRMVAEAVRVAVRHSPVESVFACEIPSLHCPATLAAFAPSVFVDIASGIDRKVQAMRAYRSERREPPHPRSSESIRALATVRGSQVGMAAAEAFELVRGIRRAGGQA